MKIGVLAGTPVDTLMGVEYFISRGTDAFGIACSKDSREQNDMQILHSKELYRTALKSCKKMVGEGAEGICVYCNSLSAAIDMDSIKKEIPVPMVTPLDIYKSCARKYSKIAVIAANGSSLAGIEKVILTENPDCSVFGAGILPIVNAIEAAVPAEEIHRSFNLKGLTDSFVSIGCEALILGCTHFPYIEKVISDNFPLPVINPNNSMLEYLIQTNKYI